jgi:hypothetical protein
MAVQTIKEDKRIKPLLEELKEIKTYLRKVLLIIPEESLREYKNTSRIKKSYLKALKLLPPSF